MVAVERRELTSQQICVPNTSGVIDDTDPCINYEGQWSTELPNITQVQNGSLSAIATTHWTTSPGSSLSLTFTGTGISVGAVYPVATFSPLAGISFQVDSSPASIVNTFNGTGSSFPTMQTMFTSSPLTSGSHTLTVQLLNNGNFTLNAFSIFGGPTNSDSDSSGSASAPVSPKGGNDASHDQSANHPLSSQSTNFGTGPGPIIGICVGVAAFSVFVTIVASILLRRLKRRRISQSQQSPRRSLVNARSQSLDNISNVHSISVGSVVPSIGVTMGSTPPSYVSMEDEIASESAEQVATVEKLASHRSRARI